MKPDTISKSTHPARYVSLLYFLTSSAGIAIGFSFVLWKWLPYTNFDRVTLEERFLFWEAVVWLVGLLLIFFGIGSALGALHLINTRMPGLHEVYSFAHTRVKAQERFSFTGVWMVVTGCVLLLVAAWARAFLLG